jgi:hypothetical protein
MALKVGTENKRNVIIAAVLGCVLIFLVARQIFGGSDTPPPVASRPVQAVQPVSRRAAGPTSSNGAENGPAAHKVANSGLDPALHLEKLALSESIEYAGHGRNIFSADSAPVQIETPIAKARPTQMQAGPVVPPPYVAPQPPAIDLKFFGYTAKSDGSREAFLIHGDDIFEAAVGEIVNHRYKVMAVNASSIQVTDLSYNNTQTLPLVAN